MTEPPRLRAVAVADPPELWRDLGFTVSGAVATVGTVAVHLGSPGAGITGWRVDGLPETADLDGLPVPAGVADDAAVDRGGHPNGVATIDHLVVVTPDLHRTAARIEDAGVALRRIRRAGGDPPREQAFFRLGEVILEVAGPAQGGGEGPARLWGLAFDCVDLDTAVAVLGDRVGPPREAVQSGRRIATLRREAGSSVPMAFMGPA
ncbi:MAG TPA: hypothetical protein VFP54_11475 [Acidimicrobiales bacterium]|nr:hypothetical protein [Acidimicrobiales bacterium]